jgi:hypothetical protein
MRHCGIVEFAPVNRPLLFLLDAVLLRLGARRRFFPPSTVA